MPKYQPIMLKIMLAYLDIRTIRLPGKFEN